MRRTSLAMRSIFAACLIAPLAAPIAFVFYVILASVSEDGWTIGTQDWQAAAVASGLFVLPVSYLATWILGFPYIYWLRRKLSLSLVPVCAGAICCGIVTMWVLQNIAGNALLNLATFARGSLIGSLFAICVALVFCWIARVPVFKK